MHWSNFYTGYRGHSGLSDSVVDVCTRNCGGGKQYREVSCQQIIMDKDGDVTESTVSSNVCNYGTGGAGESLKPDTELSCNERQVRHTETMAAT
jgi:hypothetical protein